MVAKTKPTKACDCIKQTNAKLEEKGLRLSLAFTFSGKVYPCVELSRTKPRAKLVTLACTFCPFCGQRLQDTE